MPDWKASMQQTFEFWTVDPTTWKDVKKLTNVTGCTINRDSTADTLGSATIDIIESVGECYIRVYLVTLQNGAKERFSLGTFLTQTPASSFNGKIRNVSMDAYTPLLELKEGMPPIGYYTRKGFNALEQAYSLTNGNMRAPVIRPSIDANTELRSDFVADINDKWFNYVSDLLTHINYEFCLDDLSRVMIVPKQDVNALQPVWTYDDGNSSILYPDLSMSHDLYGIPNVVEVVYSDNNRYLYCVAENHDPNSPVSIENRGRRIVHRVSNPAFGIIVNSLDDDITGDSNGIATNAQIQNYAKRLLRELATIEYTISYTHAYCPVRLGDCVRINYSRAGLTDIKARVVSQSISCKPGCPVSEKATFTTKLWNDKWITVNSNIKEGGS